MKVNQAIRGAGENQWTFTKTGTLKKPLVLIFGDRFLLESHTVLDEVRALYPDGDLIFGTTSGEILGPHVFEESITLTAIELEKTTYKIVRANVKEYAAVETLGNALAQQLPKKNLKHIFIVSEGSFVNGSGLINGFNQIQDSTTPITGGLCGDGARFERTLASYNENPKEGEVIAVGFYGDTLEVSYANFGGWHSFGPQRSITKSEGNILFEIDGKPALDLYKMYLGDKADQLPQAALLYPLSVQTGAEEPLTRTILNIDEDTNSMILAGDVPEGAKVQLMMSSTNDIAEAAHKAATLAMRNRKKAPELALLVSCVGRKLVLAGRTEEEIEEVLDVVGEQAAISGFYSYGEMAPFSGKNNCLLHNQTMTLTLISE
ncbi:FIST signal transduction protein [Flavobacterium sp. ASW18X]|uniref:FIST signal transduction protein n=1 Tax=Flavobacterium sp. ASW18X TaxID=2572595 RepID=UPI0010AE635E|nr:FIST N-terminal domain-containing protein [Flavobacterium sp. ASW18X]TKD66558.1 histidine kinase [Flavobacterium sp. ASW18X]